MDTEALHRLAEDPRFISGIYNYCDRWCERCPFTNRCMVYAMEEAEGTDPESRDLDNAAFWDRFRDTLQRSVKLLHEMAAERGIDLNVEMEKPEAKAESERRQKRKEKARKQPLPQLARLYMLMVNKWFKTQKKSFRQKGKELIQLIQIGLPGADPEAEVDDLTDVVDIIRWYQPQIYVKLARALMSRKDERREPEEGMPRDSDGSAKVALLGIDRSLAAWARMRQHFPERADNILDILVHLERLRRLTEKTFPNARAFERPGFDDTV
jgi:hypothetical protein